MEPGSFATQLGQTLLKIGAVFGLLVVGVAFALLTASWGWLLVRFFGQLIGAIYNLVLSLFR